MATQQRNAVIIAYIDPVPYPIATDGTFDINAGDQVWFDTSVHFIKALDSNAHAAYFAGVAEGGSYIQPYSVKEYNLQIGIWTKGIFSFFSTTGDTYHDGDPVYIGADAQTVTNTIGGNTVVLGVVKLGPGVSSLAGLTGVTLVNVEIAPTFPVVQSV